ncbi:leucine-responsive transcriptional regulator LEU3 Ecym_7203 [Eremothecium cymbalariae DBVPG|uniref:Zn(2)-C6 fungal-type domain-containing protein n=1 Tax=Eremothecium cymbalariae (strain CBS 270.75 / DBVPG 7215 / KCTC 17166 / NRRL Y-17582) TaxID=931890 RepID=G8JW36_ERECY|nr:hypothetical protein Ecym_7203 [Eremothecium cymbalariae DBVPG\
MHSELHSQDEKSTAPSIDGEMYVRSSSDERKQKRKKFACVECRQQKSKCDAHDRAPEPCTRCFKKNVPCVLQRDFRRTYKRARNEVIERRFKELTKSLTNLGAEEILKKIEEEQQVLLNNRNFTKDKVKKLRELGTLDLEEPSIHMSKASRNEFNEFQPFTPPCESVFLTKEQLKCAPKRLGDVSMSSADISELFQEFATKYHQFLPVVDISKGPERIYKLCPCLFWVIILISLRRKVRSMALMKKLSSMVKSIIAEICTSPIIRYSPSETDEPILNAASVYSAQALLLYTYWPPITSSLSADTSWNTVGFAMLQSIQIGLNSTQYSTEYANANSKVINERIQTWVCCNIVSQTIASAFGFQSFSSYDFAVISALNNNININPNVLLSPCLKEMAQIAHFEYQITNTMNCNPLSPTGMVNSDEKLPLLHVLDKQLTALEFKLQSDHLDDIRKFMLLLTKVHLFSYYFTTISSDSQLSNLSFSDITIRGVELDFISKRGLVRAYNSAVALLEHAESIGKSQPSLIKYFPSVFVLSIWQSACVISKLAKSSLEDALDIKSGELAYQAAILLSLDASVVKHDMAYRSSGIMRSLWSMFSNMYDDWKLKRDANNGILPQDFNLGIAIKTRMSVSVFFDCLFVLRQKCGMAKLGRELKRKLTDYEGEDGDIEDNDTGKAVNIGLTREKNPEENARKIIETIPLDPEPFNVLQNSETDTVSPNETNASRSLSLKTILNANSPEKQPRHQSVPVFRISKSSDSTPATVLEMNENVDYGTVHVQKLQSNDFLQNFMSSEKANNVYDAISSLNQNNVQFPDTESNKSSNNVEHPLYADQSTYNSDGPNTLSNFQRDSPQLLDNWDNRESWESDVVFKDVDLLMAEFAFNPSVL